MGDSKYGVCVMFSFDFSCDSHEALLFLFCQFLRERFNFFDCMVCRLTLNRHIYRHHYDGVPQGIYDGIQPAIRSGKCMVFDTELAQQSLNPYNGNLEINVTIETTDDLRDWQGNLW